MKARCDPAWPAEDEVVVTSPTPKKRKSARGIAPRSGDGAVEPQPQQHEGDDSRGDGADDEVGLVSLHSYKKAKTKLEEEEEEAEEDGALVKAMKVSKQMETWTNEQQRTNGGEGEEGGKEFRVVEIATKDELAKKKGRGLLVRRPLIGHHLAAFWHHDRPYVIDDSCPHRGAPLSEGDIEDLAGSDEDDDDSANGKGRAKCVDGRVPHIVCPLHYYKFDLSSGLCLEGHDWSDPLGVYEAWVEEERVMVRLPVRPATREDDDGDDDEHN